MTTSKGPWLERTRVNPTSGPDRFDPWPSPALRLRSGHPEQRRGVRTACPAVALAEAEGPIPEAYRSATSLRFADCRRTSGTLRSVEIILKSLSVSRASRFIESATGVFGFLASPEATA